MLKKVNPTTSVLSLPVSGQMPAGRESLAPRVFELFRYIAESPLTEIGGRIIWSNYKGNLPNEGSVNLVELTRCTTTVQALLVALFGPEITHNIMDILRFRDAQKQPITPGYLKQVDAEIQKKGDTLKNEPLSCFYAYVFGLFRNPKPSNPPASSHVFLIIQYVDDEGELYYRLFQSFLEHFDLKADFNKDSNFFSQTQFQTFLNHFEQLFLLSTWAKELEEIYVKYFHVESSLKIGEKNPYFETSPLISGKPFTFNEVEKNSRKFADLKQTAIFQKIMSNVIQ